MKTFSRGSNRVFFGGVLKFHRKSTGRIDLIGSWSDWRDDIAPWRNPSTMKFTYRPEQNAETIGTLDGIDYRIGSASPDTTGLAVGPTNEPSYLSHTFRDSRARKLTVNARAVSRFRGNFKRDAD